MATNNADLIQALYSGLGDPERLRATYDLTSAEADILVRLVEGQSTSEIAQSRSVVRGTVRRQRKALLKKMRTRRQADLIRFVLTGPVGEPNRILNLHQ